MNKILRLVIAAAGMCSTAYGQETALPPGLRYPTQQGSIMVGSNVLLGGVGFSSEGTYYNVGVTPRAGYFVLDNLAAGVELNGNLTGSAGYNSQAYGGSVFARYYFGKTLRKDGTFRRARFFAEGSGGYFAGNTAFRQSNDVTEHIRYGAFNLRGTAGMNYFISNNVALEGGIYYMHATKDYISNHALYEPTQLGFNVGFQLFLGGKKQANGKGGR